MKITYFLNGLRYITVTEKSKKSNKPSMMKYDYVDL